MTSTTPTSAPLSARVRASRKAKGWSRERVAREAKLTAKTLWSVENGSKPSAATLGALNEALGLGIEDVGAELAAFEVEASA